MHLSIYLSIYAFFTGNFAPGSQVNGYTVKAVTEIPDFNLVAVQLSHDRTLAQHLHIARKDPNNSFG